MAADGQINRWLQVNRWHFRKTKQTAFQKEVVVYRYEGSVALLCEKTTQTKNFDERVHANLHNCPSFWVCVAK